MFREPLSLWTCRDWYQGRNSYCPFFRANFWTK